MDELDDITTSCLWYLCYTTFLSFLKLPFTLYEILVVEYNHSFWDNTELLISKKLKNFIVGQILVAALAALLVSLIKAGDKVFIYSFLVFCLIVFIVGVTYPRMAPSRFRKLTLIENGDLKTKIVNLAQSLDFPLDKIYLEERFKHKSALSAYIYGSSNKKSIVISDTLISKEEGLGCTDDETLALVSLEIGRSQHRHSLKYVLLVELNLLLSFLAFFNLFRNPKIYKVFGFYHFQPELVGVYIVLKFIMLPFTSILNFCSMYFSRKLVKNNDRFVANLGNGKALIQALIRIHNKEKFPVCDHLYSMYHNDKPLLMERIKVIKKINEEKLE